jgi:RNA polymerase primary sigma factor
MLPADNGNVVSRLRRLKPAAKLPIPAVLEALPVADRRLLRRRVTEAVECVFDPYFEEPEVWQALWAGPSAAGEPNQPTSDAANPGESKQAAPDVVDSNDDSGAGMLPAEGAPCLKTEPEADRFRRLNYCRYRVLRIIEEHAGQRLSAEASAEVLRWEHAAAQIRDELVRSNVPLVLAMAKRARVGGVDFSDLVSEGSLALLRSVEKFDFSRGFRFSTYACRAILKSFSRVAARAARYRGHFPTEFDPALEKGDAVERKRVGVEDECVAELRAILGSNLASLSEIEEQVIRARFALDEVVEPGGRPHVKTLEQVGAMIGVTKERVRQIQNKALSKLRSVLEGGILSS